MKRVRAGVTYRYVPCLLDQWDARTDLTPGEPVTVVNLPGCPHANVMRHCHVNRWVTGEFAGIVCVASLQPLKG